MTFSVEIIIFHQVSVKLGKFYFKCAVRLNLFTGATSLTCFIWAKHKPHSLICYAEFTKYEEFHENPLKTRENIESRTCLCLRSNKSGKPCHPAWHVLIPETTKRNEKRNDRNKRNAKTKLKQIRQIRYETTKTNHGSVSIATFRFVSLFRVLVHARLEYIHFVKFEASFKPHIYTCMQRIFMKVRLCS